MIKRWCWIGCWLLGFSLSSQAAVLVSIKPLYGIVSRLTQGAVTTEQLLPDTASPHHYSMRPSELVRLRSAELFIWLGPDLESFLQKTVTNLPDSVQRLSLAELPALDWLAYRQTLSLEDEPASDHQHRHQDPHFWLDPLRVQALVEVLTPILVQRYPEQRHILERNAEQFRAELKALDAELQQGLATIRRQPFLVYHDSYQYLVRRYQLNERGSIVKEPQEPLSVRRLLALQQQVEQQQIGCVFEDVEYPERKLERLFKARPGRLGKLDSLGLAQGAGPGFYAGLMRQLLRDLQGCLEN